MSAVHGKTKHKRKRQRLVPTTNFMNYLLVSPKQTLVVPTLTDVAEQAPTPKTLTDALWFSLLVGVRDSANEINALAHSATCAILLYALRMNTVFCTDDNGEQNTSSIPTTLRDICEDLYLTHCSDAFLFSKPPNNKAIVEKILLKMCAPLFRNIQWCAPPAKATSRTMAALITNIREYPLWNLRADDNLFDVAYVYYLSALSMLNTHDNIDHATQRLSQLHTNTALASEVNWSRYDEFIDRIM